MHRRVTDVVASVYFDGDGFILHSIAQVELLDDQIELGGQAFFGFQASLTGRTEIDWAGHAIYLVE
jgi:hypothetical protein